jgi:hypothetical protein
MRNLVSLAILAATLLSTILISPPAARAQTETTNCLYPSPSDRFGVTVYGDQYIDDYDVTPLMAGRYLNWRADLMPSRPNAMSYYFMVRVTEAGHRPGVEQLQTIAFNNPGMVWIIGNEADVVWQDNTTPAAYARAFHSAYTAIREVDPTARFVISGIVQVSPLRLIWLDQVWDSYYATYGVEIPVDMWNIHTYVANEMHQEWGFEIPPGINNAVGYTIHMGTDWEMEYAPSASGGTVHRSRTLGAQGYFAFRGSSVTVLLGTGPDAGIAEIYLDQAAAPVAEVDLYAPTPGTLSRTYAGLTPPGGVLRDRHNIRIRVTGRHNPASTGTWIRLDAMEAQSTTGLPGGRFEDDSPQRAMIVTSVDDHDNIDLITEQIRDFRQWMLDRGQRNKPLINTEYGILMTEDIGFDYPRVRNFMLNSFDTFLNDLIDPALGYPVDGNRLLQEWFWFALAVNDFEGRVVHTGLFDTVTRAIKPLGVDFAGFVQPIHQEYVDLEIANASVTPYWPIFAGEPGLLRIQSHLRNRGNIASDAFDVKIRDGNGSLIATWPFSSLPKRYDPGYVATIAHDWHVSTSAAQSVRIIADENDQVAEPCQPNNEVLVQVTPPPFTDLALANLRTNLADLPSIQPGATVTLTLQVDLLNLGSAGTSASQVQVQFWNGNPGAGGALIDAETLTPGNVTLPITLSAPWPVHHVGQYEIYAHVVPAPEESNLTNNTQHLTVSVPGSSMRLPLVTYRYSAPRDADDLATAHPLWQPVRTTHHQQDLGKTSLDMAQQVE